MHPPALPSPLPSSTSLLLSLGMFGQKNLTPAPLELDADLAVMVNSLLSTQPTRYERAKEGPQTDLCKQAANENTHTHTRVALCLSDPGQEGV